MKRIIINEAGRKFLVSKFNISSPYLSMILNYKRNGIKAEEIRKYILNELKAEMNAVTVDVLESK